MLKTDVAMQLKNTHQRIIQLMQLKIDEYGLTFGLIQLIMLIDKNPDASQKELARKMKFTEGAMSIAVKRLLKLNMLKKITLESDMRYHRLVVTNAGKLILDDYKDHLLKKYDDMFDGFGYDELNKLNDLLLKVNRNLENMNNHNSLQNIKE